MDLLFRVVKPMKMRLVVLATFVLLLAGCSSGAYYWQGIRGQIDLLERAQPRQWCFPMAGCVNYRGYFEEAGAREEAARFAAAGDDVYIGGVPAYSTLGYFNDPLLSTFIRYP